MNEGTPETNPTTDRLMRIAISGTNGLIGSALCDHLTDQGRDVRRIVRVGQKRGVQCNEGDIRWDDTWHAFLAKPLSACDAVVHLAGENVMGHWSEHKKRRIHDSRVKSTHALAQALANLESGPRTLIVASAIGIYGQTAETQPRNEDDPPTDDPHDFLAQVCKDCEAAADPARDAGIRVVHLRIGIVLSPKGGVLGQMLMPFKLGLGGPIGHGKQWMSWISLTDLTRIITHALDTPAIAGPINAVAPNPVTNKQFTKALGHAIKRPTLLPVPPFALKLLYGSDCANATALGSLRITPKRLLDRGFTFQHSDIQAALSHELATSA